MNTRWLQISPLEPLLLGHVKPKTQFLSSLDYIPGRVLRGAWAEWLSKQGRKEEIPAYVRRLQIWNFFPVMARPRLEYGSPFLLTTLTCKREKGFQKNLHPEKKGHGVLDILLPWLAYHLLEKAGARFAVPFSVVCENCGDRMEEEKGFFASYLEGKNQYYFKTTLTYHAQTRVALSRLRHAASQGMLYTASALAPGRGRPDGHLVFIGRVRGEEECVEEFREAIGLTPIGGMRTRGYGEVEVTEVSLSVFPLQARIEAFNAKLADLWRNLRGLANNGNAIPDRPEGIFFSVDLMAPGIFFSMGVPVLIPTLNILGRSLSPFFWVTRPEFAGGWSEAWGLPKPTALVARMGSVYLFRWEGTLEELLPELESLEMEGIGERRDEGFGECWICHPFHLEVDEV